MSLWKRFDQAIFGFGSPLPMAIFRIFVGFLSFMNCVIYWVVFSDFFTERGLYPVWMSERYSEGMPRFNLLAEVTDPRVTMVVLGLATLFSLTTMIGLFTRVSSVGLFALLLTLQNRSGDVLHSGDVLLRLWVFCVAVSGAGHVLSLDRRWFGKDRPVEEVSLWPQRLVVFQLCLVYFTTVWLKWGGGYWRDGTAAYFAGNLNEMERFPVPGFMEYRPILAASTWGTLAVELALATLVFSPTMRKWVLGAGLLMHAYIEYSMNVPLFQWVIVSAYVCHFSGSEIEGWARRVADRPILRGLVAKGLWPKGEGHA
jgi:hypothetical protein